MRIEVTKEKEEKKEGQSFSDERLIEKDKYDFSSSCLRPTFHYCIMLQLSTVLSKRYCCRLCSHVDSRFINFTHMSFIEVPLMWFRSSFHHQHNNDCWPMEEWKRKEWFFSTCWRTIHKRIDIESVCKINFSIVFI